MGQGDGGRAFGFAMSAQAPAAAAPQHSVGATKDAGAMQKRIEELRVQARGLMDELPSVLKSRDSNASGFCESVVPVLMHDSAATIVERLRNGVGAAQVASVPNGERNDGLLDIRQFKSWDEACGSIGEALSKCIETSKDAHQDAVLAPALNVAASRWSYIESNSWRSFGEGHVNVVADGNTLRLASCRKCCKVLLCLVASPASFLWVWGDDRKFRVVFVSLVSCTLSVACSLKCVECRTRVECLRCV